MKTQFEKVTIAQFVSGGGDEGKYNEIILPKRATAGSAGYDFFAPSDINILAGRSMKIATGVRCSMRPDMCLLILPRSSLGFKYRLTLDNTVGVIDSDYYYADNEGHIMIKMKNNSSAHLFIEEGKAFAQGIFVYYGLTDDDDAKATRTGGFGSTDKQGEII